MKTWFEENPKTILKSLFGEYAKNLSTVYIDDADITAYLSSLCLFETLPTGNLISDPELLPDESLRLFYVDPNWINALLDGALSIGRICDADRQHDKTVMPFIKAHSDLASGSRRSLRFGKTPSTSNAEAPRTGFLLRSQLVRGWPGLEIECLSGGKALDILSMRHLDDEILLCLVQGVVETIKLTEPSEGLYFGLDDVGGDYGKCLVSLAPGKVGQATELTADLVYRNPDKRVLNVALLAQNMDTTLKQHQKNSSYFSALEFAVQMLHERTQCVINVSQAVGREEEKNEQ